MPKLSPNSIPVVEGKVVLFKRPRSPLYQARFRIRNKWVRMSTRTDLLEEAKSVAADAYMEAKFKEKNDLPVVTRKFRSVAEAVRDRFQRDFDNNVGPVINRDYVQAIDNWLIPYFGNHYVASIGHREIKGFYEHRSTKFLEKYGKLPSATAINTHATALNYVFAEAVAQEYMSQFQIPITKLKGYAAKRNGELPRASFTMDEYRQLYRYMRKWVNQTKKGKFTDMRYLLRDSVLFLANSGIRFGTEFYSIKWNGVITETSKKTGREQLRVWVNGKTGPRKPWIRYGAKKYLERIWQRNEKLKDLTWDELLKQNEPIFTLPDGTVTRALDKTFARLLKDAMLHLDSNGQARTLYSLRHFYITTLLFKNKVGQNIVAEQCGTSPIMIQRHYFHGDLDYFGDEFTE